MPEIEMMVSLVIPDNTAITAANALRKMGYTKLLNLRRESFYRFSFDGDIPSFEKKVGKIDTLVNYNKNRAEFKKPDEKFFDNRPRILIQNLGDSGKTLCHSLKSSFGLKSLKKVETGILWTFAIDDKLDNITPMAWEMARKLLFNKHYQNAQILGR